MLVFLSVIWLAIIGAAWGAAGPGLGGSEADGAETSAPAASDEYNFTWLDPEKKIYVLQNRRYTKALRVLFSGMVGTSFSNPYRTVITAEPRVAFFFSEAWGIEAFYNFAFNNANSIFNALLQAAPNTLPNIREIRGDYGGFLHWVPWYAKMNVFNKIIYFDWYIGLGGGMIQTFVDQRTMSSQPSNFAEQDEPGVFFATGQLYHLTHNLFLRLDFKGSFYNAPINGLTGGTSWYTNYNLGAGLGWAF